MSDETWKPVAHAIYGAYYDVTDTGRVRNRRTGKYLKAYQVRLNLPWKVSLHDKHDIRHGLNMVHTLVWEAFNGPLVKGQQVGFIGDRNNPALNNLVLIDTPQVEAVSPQARGAVAVREHHSEKVSVEQFWDEFFKEHAPTCFYWWKRRGAA